MSENLPTRIVIRLLLWARRVKWLLSMKLHPIRKWLP